jgi:hypothetical protein
MSLTIWDIPEWQIQSLGDKRGAISIQVISAAFLPSG